MSLKHVLWIGGPPSSGKTTIALRLARRHGLRWYGADTQTWVHRDRAVREENAAAQRWEALTVEDRWGALPEELLEMSLHRERGSMVVDDLRKLPASPLVIAEGSPLTPEVVPAGIAERTRAVWLLPTTEFHQEQLERRDLAPGARELYRLLAAEIERAATAHAVPVLRVDGSSGIEEMAAAVEKQFAKALAAGPRAESRAERRALLRAANESMAEQVRGYYARPWAVGDAEVVVREFVCECGGKRCEAMVESDVAGAVAGPVLAPGHESS